MRAINSKNIAPDLIESRECRFVLSCGSKRVGDYHLVKEKLYLKDGKEEKRVTVIEDFTYPVYITKDRYRNHTQKKEREQIDKLDMFKATRTTQNEVIATALGQGWMANMYQELYKSPYIYGTDFSSCAYIKNLYMQKYDKFSPFDVAVFDIETNMFSAEQETIIATLSFKDKVITAIHRDFVKDIQQVEKQLKEKFNEYLEPFIGKLGTRVKKWEIKICDSVAEGIIEVIKKAHEWSPDLIAIWNIDFDIPKIEEDLKREEYYPADIFSDPLIPRDARYFKYRQGRDFRKTNKGTVMPLKPAQRWHWVDTPASFFFLDAMQVYYQIRIARQDEQSYALDFILDKELGIRKLKFKEADHIKSNSPQWHQFMQRHYPLEYIIYNVFDCISVELLDEKTNDLAIAMPSGNHCSHLKDYSSQPRRLWDKLYPFLAHRGYIPGIADDKDALDEEQIGYDDWINTLPAHMMRLKKSPFYEESEAFFTKIRTHCGDLDISAAYPSNGIALNISRETTAQELMEISGVSEETRRAQGINLTGGYTNAMEFSTNMFGLPTLFELEKMYDNDHS